MRPELHDPSDIRARSGNLAGCVIQSADLREFRLADWRAADVQGAYFLGCLFDSIDSELALRRSGAVIFPRIGGLPYNPYRSGLYSAEELYAPSLRDPARCQDTVIYDDYTAKGKAAHDVVEALARRIHDHAIDDALGEYLHTVQPRLVGIMGGAGRKRTDPWYRKVALTARLLTGAGYTVVTGGGPGMMEAGNLGAWLAQRPESAIDAALDILAGAPDEHAAGYVTAAFSVKDRFPNGGDSLAIPTWFYGHEPTNIFATRIAKYFANSIREDGLLEIARYGIVFSPGSAGTRQEVFQDAAQNHYATFEYVSPMVFLGVDHFTVEAPSFPLLRKVANDKYRDLLFLSDEPAEIVEWLKAHPPVKY
jgi:predicted Rossmann-fold nucleotide-binding protein